MKLLSAIIFTILSTSALAQRSTTIDDLGSIDLNLDAAETATHDVHYPNYRMGGGNPSSRELRDCLMLDVRHSDVVVTLQQKMKLAKKLVVSQFRTNDLKPEIKGQNVVFRVAEGMLYMTTLGVRTVSGENLNEVIRKALPPVREGNTTAAPTSLIYVRDCRF